MTSVNPEQLKRVSQLYEEACAAMDQGNWQDAWYKLGQVVDIDPDFPGAARRYDEAQHWHKLDTKYQLGRKRMEAGRWSEALELFRQIQAQVPNHRGVALLIATCEREMQGRGSRFAHLGPSLYNGVRRVGPPLATAAVVIGCMLLSISTVFGLVGAPSNSPTVIALGSPSTTPTQTSTPPIKPTAETFAPTVEPPTATPLDSTPLPVATPTNTPASVPPANVTQIALATATQTPRAPTVRTSTPTPSRTPTRTANTATSTPLPGDTPTAPTATPNQPTPTPTGGRVAVITDTPTPRPPPPSATPAPRPVIVEAVDFDFNPNSFALKAGERIRFTLVNHGKVEHHWVLLDQAGTAIRRISAAADQTNVNDFIAPAPGTYSFICDISDYAQRGMKGTVTVQ